METQISQTNMEIFASASKIIWDTLAEGPQADTDVYNSCHISNSDSCDLSSFAEPTLVYPGGSTRCIFSDSTPFSYLVYPGKTGLDANGQTTPSDKLLIYFQGGGACWNDVSTRLTFCNIDAIPYGEIGIFDQSNQDNPFKDFTIVEILYCSGDLHAGNVVRDYTDPAGQPVVQVGQINTQSVLDWITTQQSNGGLAPTLSQLTLTGCSAGSVGVQVWSDVLLSSLSYHHAAVVPDSYAGVFAEGSQEPMIYDYGLCPWLTDPDLVSSCNQQTLTLQDIMVSYMKKNSNIAYAFVQSKTDLVQRTFYSAIAVSSNTTDPVFLTPEGFYGLTNEMFERYNEQANFVTYLVSGSQHCMSPHDFYYTTDASGRNEDGVDYEPKLVDWMEGLPMDGKSVVSTECFGKEEAMEEWSGSGYCDKDLMGKKFLQN